MNEWFSSYQQIFVWTASVSTLMLVIGILLLPVVLTRIPADYFVRPREQRSPLQKQHPILLFAVWIVRNCVGWLLVLAGLILLVLPGQGLLTMLAGLMLTTFPGKRRLEMMILERPMIRRAVDQIRKRYGRPSLQFPD